MDFTGIRTLMVEVDTVKLTVTQSAKKVYGFNIGGPIIKTNSSSS